MPERPPEEGARDGDVEALEACAGCPEDCAIVQPESCLLDEASVQFTGGESEAGEVHPGEIGPLGFDRARPGRFPAEGLLHEDDVVRQVFHQLVEPIGTMSVGGLAGDQPHDVGLAEALRVQFPLEGLSRLGVGDEDIGVVQGGEVKGLAGGGADCACVGYLLGGGGEHRMAVPRADKVLMDSVGPSSRRGVS